MNDSIYKMMNDANTDISEYQEAQAFDAVTAGEFKKSFKKRVGRKTHYRGVAVAACCCLVAAVLVAGPFQAQVKAAGKYLIYSISSAFGIEQDLSPYEKVINKTVHNANGDITLNSVILTETSLIVSTTEQLDEETRESGDWLNVSEIYVNGRACFSGAAGSTDEIEPGVTSTVMEYMLSDVDTTGTLDIELIMFADEHGTENWKFAFQADSEKIRAKVQKQELVGEFTIPDGGTITLETFEKSPLWYQISFSAEDYRFGDYDISLMGKDNLGNDVSFYCSYFDGKGYGEFRLDNLDGSIEKEATSITLTPYTSKLPEGSGQVTHDWVQAGEAFTIELN